MPVKRNIHGSISEIHPEESSSRFARIFEATADVVAMTDRDGYLLYLNAAGRRVLSLPPEAPISGHTLRDIHPEWACEILLQEALPAALSNGSWSGETAMMTIAGMEFPVLQTVLAHVGPDGKFDFFSTICRDISDRKMRELEHIEWANRYNAAIRASGQVVFDWDVLTDDVAYGGEIEQLLGYSVAEMAGGMKRLRELIFAEDLDEFDERIDSSATTRDPFEHSFRARHANGSQVILHAQGCFFLDRQGHIGRMVGFLKDVTKECLTERAIQMANERLEQRVRERTSELAKANLELKNSAMRQTAVARLGHRALAGLALPELMSDAARTVREMLDVDCTSVLEYDDASGEFKCVAEFGWPVPVGVYPIPGGNRSQSGYTVQTGDPIVCPDMRRETRFEISEAVIAAGLRSSLSVCIRSGERPLGVLAAFTLNQREFSRDDVTFAESISNVITAAIERHQAEESIRYARAEAESANRAKSEFLSRMSHELRTPLNAILGFTQLLEMEDHNEKQQESIVHISRAGRNLLDLINEVLDIARLDAGRVQFVMEAVDVKELIREVVSFSTPIATKGKVSLRIADPPDEEAFVSADRERLKQVLLNLLSNGVKYNQESGSVTIALAKMSAGMWRISVTDTGVGIPQEKLARLFVPFERLGTREGGTEGGTGLGLALCQRLVAGLGGRIGVASSMGLGSTFWVELPAVSIAPAHAPTPSQFAAAAQTPSKPEKETKKILCIEDDAANYYLLERFLSTRKEIVLMSALQGSIGLDLAREHQPDLILLDLNLPDMNGEEVLRTLKGDPKTAHFRVVAVTGEVIVERERELRQLGVLDFLVKPYRLAEIHDIIEKGLAAKP